jgi:3-methyl-2-oxobutanoate hydroxymethyltransferase
VGLRALACAPRRTYGNLALRDENAKELARLASGSAEVLSYPDSQEAEPAEARARVKMTLHALRTKHARDQPISMITAYDYPSARLADAAGVDVLLVGDSVGMVVLGREDTTDVTMDEMVHHCRAASRGTAHALLLGDLPFGACITPLEAARNGVRLVKEGRVDAVKLEGGERVTPHVRALVDAGVAVCGHIGLTPQSYSQLGGYRVQGKTAEHACSLLREAQALEQAGCFGIVLEMVPTPVAEAITARLSIPTFGIGAGHATSGQVQVFHDVLGLYDKLAPRFARRFGSFEGPMVDALKGFAQAIDTRAFPQADHAFSMDDAELTKFRQALDAQTATQPAAAAPPVDQSGPKRASASSMEQATSVRHAPAEPALLSNGLGELNGLAAAVHVSNEHATSSPVVVRTVAEWRGLQRAGALPRRGVGLVPTMGALHDGHLSLVRQAHRENDAVAVSLFVNPTQFAPSDDLATYPRPWEADLAKLADQGVGYVFAPTAEEMYPPTRSKRLAPYVDLVDVETSTAEGGAWRCFFRGVSTVVTKLLHITQPRSVYFGQKDGMQCMVVRRLIEDLNFDTRLVVCDTVREADGLAMSSRNAYLSPVQRTAAPAVYAALLALESSFARGERSVGALRAEAADVIAAEPLMHLDYLSLASALDGRELGEEGEHILAEGEPTLASIAVNLGTTRLIDNVVLG